MLKMLSASLVASSLAVTGTTTVAPTTVYEESPLTVERYWCDPDGSIYYTVHNDDPDYGYLFEWDTGGSCGMTDTAWLGETTSGTVGDYTYEFVIGPECQSTNADGLQSADLSLYFSYAPDIGLLKDHISQTVVCKTIDPEYIVEYIFSNVTLPETVQEPGEPDEPLSFSITRMTDATFTDESTSDGVFGGEEVFIEITPSNDDYKTNVVNCVLSDQDSGETYELFNFYTDYCVEPFLGTNLEVNTNADGSVTWRLNYGAFTFSEGDKEVQTQKLTCTLVACSHSTAGYCNHGSDSTHVDCVVLP